MSRRSSGQGAWRRAGAFLGNVSGRRVRAGFTLVELIVVMVLLLIVASMVAPRMSSFFRGRALNQEARRMLSLIHLAQSRAVSEGVPVLLWVDARSSTYGIEVQGGHMGNDDRDYTMTAEPTLTLETPTVTTQITSELDDDRLGLPEDRPAIRFNSDGFFDETSIQKIVIRQDDAALEIAPTVNRLNFEIRPYSGNAN